MEQPPDADGKRKHRPFHVYTMKQAIQEGFILDVLRCYTPVSSYHRLVKTVPDAPEVDTKKARKKLRKYVEGHDHAVRVKAEIVVDHFREQVLAARKVGGRARAMVVCNGVERAVQYHTAISAYLAETGGKHKALVAYSGEHDGQTEEARNGFPGKDIAARFKEDDSYRFLVCADKFQTGYDEPLLHTMYVDKPLAGIQSVQTLSRLNRAHPAKHNVFVLDFQNSTEVLREAFADYYRTTALSDATDPDKLHVLAGELDQAQGYAPGQVDELVALFLGGADRGQLDPILDDCVAEYLKLDEDAQVRFKSAAKAFTRTYDFLATVLSYPVVGWEKRSILLNFLLPKLPAPAEEDLSKWVLDAIDMDSYRPEKQAALAMALPDEDAVLDPAAEGGGGRVEPTFDRLSVVLKGFNDEFGTLFTDADRIARRITDEIVPKVAADPAYQNAKTNTPAAARIELDAALNRATQPLFKDDTEFYKQFVQNPAFRRFVTDMVQKRSADPTSS